MIDANGTRMHVLLGERDWQGAQLDGGVPAPATFWDAERSDLTLEPRLFAFPPAPGGRELMAEDRRGAARDRFGSVYWIAPEEDRILVQSSGTGRVSVYWTGLQGCVPHRRPGAFVPRPDSAEAEAVPPHLRALAVTADHYLVAGTVEPGGLLVFDLRAGGLPRWSRWPEELAFEPFDMTAPRDGGVVVLERAAPARLWAVNRHFEVVPVHGRADAPGVPDFAPLDGAAPRGPTRRPRGERAISARDAVEPAGDPVAVEALRDGSVLVVDAAAPAAVLLRYRDGVAVGPPVALADQRHGVSVKAHDVALLPPSPEDAAGALGRLYVADRQGDQAYAFDLSADSDQLRAVLVPAYLPMRRFAGRALVAGGGEVRYDMPERWVALAEQRRPRHVRAAEVVTRPLAGDAPGCVWHRLTLDACLPPGAAVEVDSRAADREEDLLLEPWVPEPGPQRRARGPELPLERWSDGAPYATFELLFQQAHGRLLQVRLRLTGDGRVSPRLRALRIRYPRFSYLREYLPGIYAQDPVSASFLERFLANVEGINTGLEDRIATAEALFDPRSAPREALDWLAGWMDVALDPAWGEARRRLFLRHAMDVFATRGTIRGLQTALRLALDPCAGEKLFAADADARTRAIRIVEAFRARRVPAVVLGDPEATGPRVGAATPRWEPAAGGEELHRRWAEAIGTPEDYPLSAPAGREELWRGFSEAVLGFVPGKPAAAPEPWRAYLARRYGSPRALNTAYGLAGAAGVAAFGEVQPPAELPRDGAPLRDWWQFEALVTPRRRAAHRFRVLLPVPVGGDEPPEHLEARTRALADRIVALQKPAHTVFDVRFYWAAFRIGEARLGLDTAIDTGSRSVRLLAPAVLGDRHLGEIVTAGEPAARLGNRPSVGRDPLAW